MGITLGERPKKAFGKLRRWWGKIGIIMVSVPEETVHPKKKKRGNSGGGSSISIRGP